MLHDKEGSFQVDINNAIKHLLSVVGDGSALPDTRAVHNDTRRSRIFTGYVPTQIIKLQG